MFSSAFQDLTKPQVLNILGAVKKSKGITIADLARELEMSYMGVKQHCQKLEKLGYLKTWRVPRQGVGRPEKLYQLTEKCNELFPQPGVELVLDVLQGVKQFFGDSSPEKIFFHHFETQKEQWLPQISKGKSLVEKATRLADLRDKAGCFSNCKYDKEHGFRIEEYHHPMQEIYKAYPRIINLEIRMMEQLLGTKVLRKEVRLKKGGSMIVYTIGTL